MKRDATMKWIVTAGGLGLSPKAPGTVGSVGGVLLGMALHLIGGFPLLALGVLASGFGGLYAATVYMKTAPGEDPQEIVIDEVCGQLIALVPLSFGLWLQGFEPMTFLRAWPGWVGGFLMFRLFDIWKPGWVGRADRMGGPKGVMLDDVVAGIFAALVVTVAAVISHEVLMR